MRWHNHNTSRNPGRHAPAILPLRANQGSALLAFCALALSLMALSLVALPNPALAEAVYPTEENTEPTGYDTGYSYFKEVEGNATLFQGGDGERQEVEVHQPVLSGDRVYTSPGARLEIVLSDYNLLRLDGDTEVSFEAIAYSPASEDRVTILNLRQGNLQLVVADDALGDELPRFYTGNSTIYLHKAGNYRLTAGTDDWSALVVREGYAEVVANRGSLVVRSGEEASVEGRRSPRTELVRAGPLDGLERWGDDLYRAVDELPYVDEDLRYAASGLDDHGKWLRVDGRYGWRPRYSGDWRPYWKGRWTHTPAGLYWVSYEPWGAVPYHYGYWDYLDLHGWVWFPGNRFSPAYVHWYWGDGYAGWIPSGLYVSYYRGRYGSRFGLGWGVYGWAGGSWDPFYDWYFCPTRYLGHRRQWNHHYTGRSLRRHTGWREVPRGIITTDTRRLDPDHWRNDRDVRDVLLAQERDRRGVEDLPDVTSYIAREPRLTPEVQRRVRDPLPVVTESSRRGNGVPAEARRATDSGRTGAGSASPGSAGTVQRQRVDSRDGARTGAPNNGVATGGESSRGRADSGSVTRSTGRRTDTARPTPSRPEATRPEATRPETSRPDEGRSDVSRSDRGRPSTVRPSDRARSGSGTPASREDSADRSRSSDRSGEVSRAPARRSDSGTARESSSARESSRDNGRESSSARESSRDSGRESSSAREGSSARESSRGSSAREQPQRRESEPKKAQPRQRTERPTTPPPASRSRARDSARSRDDDGGRSNQSSRSSTRRPETVRPWADSSRGSSARGASPSRSRSSATTRSAPSRQRSSSASRGTTSRRSSSSTRSAPQRQRSQPSARSSAPSRSRSSASSSSSSRSRSSARSSAPSRSRSSARSSAPSRSRSSTRSSAPSRSRSSANRSAPSRSRSSARSSAPSRSRSSASSSSPSRSRSSARSSAPSRSRSSASSSSSGRSRSSARSSSGRSSSRSSARSSSSRSSSRSSARSSSGSRSRSSAKSSSRGGGSSRKASGRAQRRSGGGGGAP
ncbi:MAG: DUF6600 domain-containing protein [Acidobacteriota bacterium]|nr:DUF6600 domain-containing protein [Acidobacteriota bacterium]